MPEHLHLLMRPATQEQTVANVLRGIKAGFAKIILRRWRELDAPILNRITDASGRARFWQPGGGYDRNLYKQKTVIEKIAYIHRNPILRGLSDSPSDWRWSSARWYEKSSDYRGPEIDHLT